MNSVLAEHLELLHQALAGAVEILENGFKPLGRNSFDAHQSAA